MGNTSSSSNAHAHDSTDPQASLLAKEKAATYLLLDELSNAQRRFADEFDTIAPLDNSAHPYSFSPAPLPLDDDGYCVSFSVDEPDAFLDFYHTYGLVVIRDVLTEDECRRSEDECWSFIERHSEGRVKRDDVITWDCWPALSRLGILGSEVVLSPQFFENRQNPHIHKAFTHLLGSDDLISNIGRASCMRPTRGVKVRAADATERFVHSLPPGTEADDEISVDVPRWKTVDNWLHWDLSPWTGVATQFAWHSVDWKAQRGYFPWRTQSILSLVDCGPNDGGFHCVPGFHKHIQGWAHAHPEHYRAEAHVGSINVPADDEIRKHICKVPLRKGSLMVWMSTLPHGTFPNDSSHGRMIQYVGFARKDDPTVGPLFTTRDVYPERWEPSALGKRLFGIP